MHRDQLVEVTLLDPRDTVHAAADPVSGAVNIPLSELHARTHELPPRERVIRVVGTGVLANAAVAALADIGRRAEIVSREEAIAVLRNDEARATPDSDAPAIELGRLWTPTAFLSEVLPQIEAALDAQQGAAPCATDLACGTGRDAVFLASRGWGVTAIDWLPDALERGRDLERRYAAALSRPIRWLALDLEAPDIDTAALANCRLATCFRFLHRPLLLNLRRWLRPGSHFVFETFTAEHRRRHGKPGREQFVLQPGELLELLADWEIRHASENWHGDAHTARVWAVVKDRA